MLYTVVAVLLVLWLLGLIGGVTVGGLIHVLLLIALMLVVLRIISGKRTV